MQPKRALIIANPAAGRGKGRAVAEEIQQRLEARDCKTEIQLTARSYSGDKTAPRGSCESRAGEWDRVVIVGGDGTLRQAVAEFGEWNSTCLMALVPLGNANVVARELDLPFEIDRSVDLIARGNWIEMDAGRANGALFLAMVGIGFDARVTALVDQARATQVGGWFYNQPAGADVLYMASGIAAGLRERGQYCSLSVDGNTLQQPYANIWISNTRHYAKGWSVTPNASVRDGRLNYQACKSHDFRDLLTVMQSARRREYASAELSDYGTLESCRIENGQGLRWQLDGDPMPAAKTLDIQVLPRYFRIIVP